MHVRAWEKCTKNDNTHLAAETLLVDDANFLRGRAPAHQADLRIRIYRCKELTVRIGLDVRLSTAGCTCLCHNDNFLPWELEFLDRVAENDLGVAI